MTKKLVSIEDHNIIGGLGSAISEVLTEEYPAKLIRLGIKDKFGKSGNAKDLMKYFQILGLCKHMGFQNLGLWIQNLNPTTLFG